MSLARALSPLPEVGHFPIRLGVGLVLVLVAELIGFSVHFESADLPADAAWSVGLIGGLGWLAKPVIVAIIAATCLGFSPVRAVLQTTNRPENRWRFLPFLLGHVVLMATLVALSDALIGGLAASRYADLAVGFWFGCGLAAMGLWMGSLLPWALWAPVLRVMVRPMAWGGVAGTLAMVAGRSTATLWDQFHRTTFQAVSAVLGLFFDERVCDPSGFVLGVRQFTVEIAPACSGYEGIGLIWAFLSVYLILFRHELRFPLAFLLLPIGTAVIWAANVVRIVALIAIGAAGYPGLASGGFHSQSGWIAFNVVGLGLVLASRASGLLARPTETVIAEENESNNPVVPFVLPLLVLVASAMIAGAMSPVGFDYLYPVRVVATVATLWWLHRRSATYVVSISGMSVVIGVLVFAVWMAMEPSRPSGTVEAVPSALLAMSPVLAFGWILARVIGSVVTVPIVEELAFRGFLLRRLVGRDFEVVTPQQFTWFSIILSSACFGALHGRWMAGTLAGIAYALAYRHRGKLGDAVVAHAVTNGLIASIVLVQGRWSMWI